MKKFLSLALAFAMVFSSMAFAFTTTSDAATFNTKKRVTGVKLSVQSYSSIKISWSKYKNAKGYKVYRATKKTGKYKLLKTTTSRSYTNKSLKAKTRYYYKVRAYKVVKHKTKYSKYSYIKSAVTKAKPKPKPQQPTICCKDGCNNSVYVNNGVTYNYCSNHLCKFLVKDASGKTKYCGNLCEDGCARCTTHTCSVIGCNNPVMTNGEVSSIYCASHGCSLVRNGKYCTELLYKKGFCKEHLCPVCEKMKKNEGSNYCSCCRCTLKGCDEPRIDGAEGNDRNLGFQCCEKHQCSYVIPNWNDLIAPFADLESDKREEKILELARENGVDLNGRCVKCIYVEGSKFCANHMN